MLGARFLDKNKYLSKLQQLRRKFGFDMVSLATVISGTRRPLLTWNCATGNLNYDFQRIVLESGKGIAGGVHKSKKVMLIQDAFQEMTGEEIAEHPIILAENLFCVMAVPLWHNADVHAVLLMGYRTANMITEHIFYAIMEELLPSFADFAVQSTSYTDVIHKGQDSETVPIYELMYYPVIQAREKERRQIARELHDGVLQDVLSVQMMLRTLKYQKTVADAEQVLKDADQWLNQIQNEIRGLSSSLRPVTLDDWGLYAALRSQFERMENVYSVTIELTQNIKDTRYDSVVETAFYRVCQEAVANACKYANTKVIYVELMEQGQNLILTITDQGKGFFTEKPEVQGGGQGLSDMFDWAELIDGTLTIESSLEQGSRVQLTASVGKSENNEIDNCR